MLTSNIIRILTAGVFAGFASAPVASALTFDQNVTPGVIFGSGNANGGFTVDQANGIELGLRAKLRHNATGAPQNVYNSNGDGTYSFAAGVAPTQPSPTAVWSFEWSINSNYNGSGGVLNAYTYLLQVDNNPTQAVNFYLGLDPINGINPNHGLVSWDHSLGTNATTAASDTVIAQTGNPNLVSQYAAAIASNNVAQNSWKAHWFIAPFNPTVDGTYDFKLTAYSGSTAVASTQIQVIVGAGGAAVPDSGSMAALLGCAFLGLVGIRRVIAKR